MNANLLFWVRISRFVLDFVFVITFDEQIVGKLKAVICIAKYFLWSCFKNERSSLIHKNACQVVYPSMERKTLATPSRSLQTFCPIANYI